MEQAKTSCQNCGASADPAFDKCPFCESSLPGVGAGNYTDEELITEASLWVGRCSQPTFTLHDESTEQTTVLKKGDIVGHANKYLNLLMAKSVHTPDLSPIVSDLRSQLDKNRMRSDKNEKYYGLF